MGKDLRIKQIYENVLQAVARGWCYPKNEKKIVDIDLAEAISLEVSKMIIATKLLTA